MSKDQQPVDNELESILDGFFGVGETINFPNLEPSTIEEVKSNVEFTRQINKLKTEAKARLLQWGTRQVIKELQNQRIRFEVPEEELGINGYPRPGAAGRNALKRKELHYLDKKIAELQASLKDGGTK